MNQPPPGATIEVRSEVEDLAAGFAAGFKSIGSVPVYLTHVRGDKVTVIVSVKAVAAARGVLIVTLDSGQTYLLNPLDVVSISDAPPQKR